ncbi:MAG: hypothetical protein ABSD44_16195 [Terracidiphilus sp.]
MRTRAQIALENEMRRRSRQRAGVPERPQATADIASIFDHGSSGGSDIARNKGRMIAEAFQSAHVNPRKDQIVLHP